MLSPFSKMPLWLASSAVRATTRPLSPGVGSHFPAAVAGQVEAGGALTSPTGTTCWVIAPVIRMSSTHQPSSFRLSFQHEPAPQPYVW